ncbi:MAG: GNAT family N-acetyltransferase, partial [Bacteroidales bacterium]
MIIHRHTIQSDIPQIMHIIRQAQSYFKSKGIDQWQNGYPNSEALTKDIELGHSYVFLQHDHIIATAMISFDGEPTYDQIEGAWLNNEPYAVVHRIAVENGLKGKNVAGRIFNIVRDMCHDKDISNMRVDTHRDNQSMQRVLEKWGFTYCGIIYLRDGSERLAYQWCEK